MFNEPMRAIDTPQESYCYYGDHPGWLVVIAVTRDSDALERSNFRVIERGMTEEFGDSITVERINHWLCGWIDMLLVDPTDTNAVNAANAQRARLADYPCADEMDYSELEYEGAMELVEMAAHDASARGHDVPQDASAWVSPYGDAYEASCALCGHVVVVYADSQSYGTIPWCTADEADGGDND